MVRDIQDSMERFNQEVYVQRIALTAQQIRQYDLPPNPARKSDPRSKRYYEEFGYKSWELDALDPKVLTNTLTKKIRKYLDVEYNAIIDREDEEIGALGI